MTNSESGFIRIGLEIEGESVYEKIQFSDPWKINELQLAVGLSVKKMYESITKEGEQLAQDLHEK